MIYKYCFWAILKSLLGIHKSVKFSDGCTGRLVVWFRLSKLLLNVDIQEGEHSSVKDAQITMRLYTTFKKEWEAELHNRKIKANEEKSIEKADDTRVAVIKDGEFKKNSEIEILTGNENHKRYFQNKLRKRNVGKKFFK